jgi:hypothetical protein
VGLADCAIAESKFEKGEDVAGRMLSLLPQMNEVRNYGTSDMEFAVSGLLARSQLANGQPMDARRTIEVLRECFAERGLTRFLPNMDAMLCRIDMHTGDLDAADAWYREKAPCEPTHLNVMRRYRYLTQAMVEIMQNRPDAALLTLSPMEPYIQNCARIIDGIHLNVLTAIALRRKKDSSMRVAIQQVKDGAAQAAVSAGNTGALMAIARYLLKTLDGIDRPAIATQLPNAQGGATTVLDLGANVDCSAEHLLQFAVMGSALVSALQEGGEPTVGLLNIGEEIIKGSEVIKKAGELLRTAASSGDLNFYGNVEGNDIFKGTVDIVVCDGFVGNVAMAGRSMPSRVFNR